ncbi:hypothetical protein [Sinomonas mesophila]|uniref:hypothetical protein n=1 Tax=Sinomonas mesophila TaxID=1531955 RepID=UPI0009873FBC|nr:hypothetical protein [Sinomonas mesophila]
MGKAARLRAVRPDGAGSVPRGAGRGSVRDPRELSEADLAALREHCADAVRALGFRSADRGDHLQVTGGPFRGSGAQLGTASLERLAALAPEDEWAQLAKDYVGELIGAALSAGEQGASLGYAGQALRDRLFPRFTARITEDRLAEDYTYARRIGGLPLVLALRHGQTSKLVADIHLAKAGGPEAAWAAAEKNLFAAGIGRPTAYAKDGAAVVLLESEHPRQASWLAYPDRLMEAIGIEPGPLGILFGVPALRQITFQTVTEETTMAHLGSMIELHGILALDEAAPLSTHLYHWRPGEPVSAATSTGEEGPVLTLPQSVMEAIAGPGSEAWEVQRPVA